MRKSATAVIRIILSAVLLQGIIVPTLALTSCSAGSPEQVVAKYMVAIVKRDMDTAKRYCTDRYNSSYNSSIETMLTGCERGLIL